MSQDHRHTYYDVLEVSESASAATIAAAYRSLAKRWHPDSDRGNQAEATAAMRRINEAYEVLSDPERRRQYDMELAEARAAGQRPASDGAAPAGLSPAVREKYAESVAKAHWIPAFLGSLVLIIIGLGLLMAIPPVEAFFNDYPIFYLAPWVAAFVLAGAYVEHAKDELLRTTDDQMLRVLYEERERKRQVRQIVGGVAVVVLAFLGLAYVLGDDDPAAPPLISSPPAPAAPRPTAIPSRPEATPAPALRSVTAPAARTAADRRLIQVHNECHKPVRLAIAHDPDGTSATWLTHSWWQYRPGERSFLALHNVRLRVVRNIRFYAESEDHSSVWHGEASAGDPVHRVDGRSYFFRRITLREAPEGHWVLGLTCRE